MDLFPPPPPASSSSGRAGLPSRSQAASPVHPPAGAAPAGPGDRGFGGGGQPTPLTHRLRPRFPSPVAAGDAAAAGAHPEGTGKGERLSPALPSPGALAEEKKKRGGGHDSEGLILRRKAAAAEPAAPRLTLTAGRGGASPLTLRFPSLNRNPLASALKRRDPTHTHIHTHAHPKKRGSPRERRPLTAELRRGGRSAAKTQPVPRPPLPPLSQPLSSRRGGGGSHGRHRPRCPGIGQRPAPPPRHRPGGLSGKRPLPPLPQRSLR